MWNLWWVIQQQLDCKSFVEAFAGLKTAKHTYRTFVKSSLIVSRESNVPTRRSGIWNCCDIQPRGRRQKVSLVHNSSHPRKITQETKSGTEMKFKMKLLARFLLTFEETHLVNRDIEGDVRDALVKIAPCCVRRLSIQQRQWYQDIIRHRNEIIVAMKLVARFLLISEEKEEMETKSSIEMKLLLQWTFLHASYWHLKKRTL